MKKIDYDTKVTELEKTLTGPNHDKYITTTEFNNLAARAFTARLTQANLTTKTDFDDKLKSLIQNVQAKQNIYILKVN